jgi:hypothetical protein
LKKCEQLCSEIRSACTRWDTAADALRSIPIALGFVSFLNSQHADLTELQKAPLELAADLGLTVFDKKGAITIGDRVSSIPDDLRVELRSQSRAHVFGIVYLIACAGCGY